MGIIDHIVDTVDWPFPDSEGGFVSADKVKCVRQILKIMAEEVSIPGHLRVNELWQTMVNHVLEE